MARRIAGAIFALAVVGLVACGDEANGPTTGPEVATVTTTPDTAIGAQPGDTVEFDATASDAGGDPVPGVQFTWSVRDASVGTVDDDGTVTQVAQGGTTWVIAAAAGARDSSVFIAD